MLVKSATNKLDTKEQILRALGCLATPELSSSTREHALEELSKLLKGQSPSVETFANYGIAAELIVEKDKTETLVVDVPAKYTMSSSNENNEAPVKVSFTLTKVLDMDFRNR